MLKGAVLYAKNLDILVNFFCALVEGSVEDHDDDFAVIKAGDAELIILQTPPHISSKIEITNPPVVRAGTPLKPIISVLSIDGVLETVSKNGGMILPGASRWKFRDTLVQDIVDPEGNVIQLWQPA